MVVSVPGHFGSRVVSVPGRFGPWSFLSRVVSNQASTIQSHFGLRSFRSRVFSVPGHFGPWSFRFTVVSIPGCFGYGSFRSRIVPVSAQSAPVRFGPGPFGPGSFWSRVISIPRRSFQSRVVSDRGVSQSLIMAVYVLPTYLHTST